MMRAIASFAGGAILASTGVALGAAHGTAPQKAIPLQAGDSVAYAGLVCTAYAGTTATNANVVCVRDNLKGLGVIVSQQTVVVARRVSGRVHVMFRARNA